jgi:hypothetical protein
MAATKGRKGGKRKASSTTPRKRKTRAIAAEASTPKGKGRTRTKSPPPPPPPPRKRKAKKRDYKAEYARRVANAEARGLTRQRARGHEPKEHLEPKKLLRDRVRREVERHEAHGARATKSQGGGLEMPVAQFEAEIRRILAQPYGWETLQEIREVRAEFRRLYKEMGSEADQMTFADLEEEAERLDCDVRLLFYRSVTWH